MKKTLRKADLFVGFVLACFFSGCGYGWQSTSNPWKSKGVEKIYIRTLVNETLRPGVEVAFTSALVKEFARGKRLKITTSEADADGIITGQVQSLSSVINSSTTVPGISNDPAAKDLSEMLIATDYSVSASIGVSLVRKRDGFLLWSQSFGRSKIYPAGNRFGLSGTTSSLINSSQEQIALGEIAQFLASDAYDTMLEAF